ncbi:MAG TPA: hypothetical protein VNW53_18910 [Phenylobacterium sp.]|uniref:hypothetical protein n=1 Tax=Phenylobacterium sp. TaxID=1871053 RepID=UPI002BEFCF76|nr:hypothetical protein [Phenylobacterium sp.]HXA41078.1 hypothetical protein [Phenylobacterium sp.]
MPANPIYVMHFEWPEGAPADVNRGHELEAWNDEHARMQAALLYAGASFDDPAPMAYRIVGPGGGVVYRYPELSDALDAPRPWPRGVPLPGTR